MQNVKTTIKQSLKNAEHAFLALEAKRFRYAFEYDPILGMSVSKVDPLPHQIEAVYKYVLKKSKIRFMLAHDPGAGKTVMAGLTIKEIELREGRKRILVIVPGQLKEQWKWELQDKFDDEFQIIDRAYFDANKKGGSGSVWDGDHMIASIDFAKRDDIIESLYEARRFDIVIVDEAHKMSAYSSGKSTTKTRRYRLGEVLSANTEHLLFLTATPHKGDTTNFQLLLDLLEPGYLADDDMIKASIRQKDNPLFLRRAKEDMRDFDGKPLFVPRSVETPDVKLSPKEKTLYNAMSKYVKEQYSMATQSSKGHNITFALIILQRRFASSAFALLESLKRRKSKLEHLKQGPDGTTTKSSSVVSMEKTDEMSESERWIEESKWELLSMAQTKEDLQLEIDVLDKLILKTQSVLAAKAETKLKQLKSTINKLNKETSGEKILIFTESKDTLDHLVSNIEKWGYTVNTIHGAMNPKERRRAESVFKDRTQIMVATEAAGEGINLQFCHLMINYDLPWNPNRLEQRMGRIHRYGQKHPVSVFNMVASDTREGQIMQILFEKLEIIKTAMGTDKVFDVISEIMPGKSLSQMLLDATVRSRRQNVITTELEESLSLRNKEVMNYMNDSLASKFIDYSSLDDLGVSRERQLVPEYTRNLFEKILAACNGNIKWTDVDIASIKIPPEIIQMIETGGSSLPELYTAATFDKRVRMANPGTELLTFGHPVFNAALNWAEQQYSDAAMSGATFSDASGKLNGYIVFAEGSVDDGSGVQAGRQLFACYVDEFNNVTPVSPSIILDLTIRPNSDTELKEKETAMNAAMNAASGASLKMIEKFADELAKDRDKEAVLDKKYGLDSLDLLVKRISDDIIQLLDKKRRGKKMDLAIYNKRQERQKYKQSRKELRNKIKTKTDLSVGDVSIVGIARVYPESEESTLKSKTAIDAAMKFEKESGRKYNVLSGQGFGFDIRSSFVFSAAAVSADKNQLKTIKYLYIQAKAASSSARSIIFTPNEWFRAKMLADDCYLYFAVGDELIRVQNPAERLDAALVESGYKVNTHQIKENRMQ